MKKPKISVFKLTIFHYFLRKFGLKSLIIRFDLKSRRLDVLQPIKYKHVKIETSGMVTKC